MNHFNHSMSEKLNALYTSLSEDEKNRVSEFIHPFMDRVQQFTNDLDDEELIASAYSMFFAEFKAHWLNLNNKIQYETFFKEMVPHAETHKSTALSFLIEEMEKLIPSKKVISLNTCLSDNHTGLIENDPYAVVEADKIVLMGKRKIIIHKSPAGQNDR